MQKLLSIFVYLILLIFLESAAEVTVRMEAGGKGANGEEYRHHL